MSEPLERLKIQVDRLKEIRFDENPETRISEAAIEELRVLFNSLKKFDTILENFDKVYLLHDTVDSIVLLLSELNLFINENKDSARLASIIDRYLSKIGRLVDPIKAFELECKKHLFSSPFNQ